MNTQPDTPPANALAMLRFQQKAEHAFIGIATSYAIEEFQFMDQFQELEFDQQIKALPKQFLNFDEVPSSEYGNPESAIAFGMFKAIDNPAVARAVEQLVDGLFPLPTKAQCEARFAALGLTPQKLEDLAEANYPKPVEIELEHFASHPEVPPHYQIPTRPQPSTPPRRSYGLDLN